MTIIAGALRSSKAIHLPRIWFSTSGLKNGQRNERVKVLVLNAGSSSVKYGLFSIATSPAIAHQWRPKDSSLLATGSQKAFRCACTTMAA